MMTTTSKIIQYIKSKKIGMIGDYDVDGSSATLYYVIFFLILVFLMSSILNRIKEGYGPNINAFKSLKKRL